MVRKSSLALGGALLMMGLVVGCTPAPPTGPPDPVEIEAAAAEQAEIAASTPVGVPMPGAYISNPREADAAAEAGLDLYTAVDGFWYAVDPTAQDLPPAVLTDLTGAVMRAMGDDATGLEVLATRFTQETGRELAVLDSEADQQLWTLQADGTYTGQSVDGNRDVREWSDAREGLFTVVVLP